LFFGKNLKLSFFFLTNWRLVTHFNSKMAI
jgi:hypothetical protein